MTARMPSHNTYLVARSNARVKCDLRVGIVLSHCGCESANSCCQACRGWRRRIHSILKVHVHTVRHGLLGPVQAANHDGTQRMRPGAWSWNSVVTMLYCVCCTWWRLQLPTQRSLKRSSTRLSAATTGDSHRWARHRAQHTHTHTTIAYRNADRKCYPFPQGVSEAHEIRVDAPVHTHCGDQRPVELPPHVAMVCSVKGK